MLQLNSESVFKKVSTDAIKNIIFYGIATAVIGWIGSQWRMFGLIFAGILTLVVAVSLIGFLISFIAGIMGVIVALKEKKNGNSHLLSDQRFLWGGTLFQLVENGVSVLYIWYLYGIFF